MEQSAGECSRDAAHDIVIEEHISLFVVGDGVCRTEGTGLTWSDETSFPLECIGPAGADPEPLCDAQESGHHDDDPGIEYGITDCRVDNANQLCVCTRADEFESRYVTGIHPCEIGPTTMTRGSSIEYAFSVDGDYLVRRLTRYPQPPSGPPNTYYGFEIFRRSASD
jgi:hypothetical protein